MTTPVPNRQMQNLLDALADLGPLPIETLNPDAARQIPLPDRAAVALYGQHLVNRALAPMPPPVGKVTNVTIPGVDDELVARIYHPPGDAPEGGWPSVVYFHGGGWVLADLNTYDTSCRTLCVGAGAVVVAIQYRKAPEHPWPAAVDDAFAGYQWVRANTAFFGGNGAKVAVAGESAGGNLATVVALVARDKGAQPPLHQVLIYPVTDVARGSKSESAFENAAAKPLNQPMLDWFYDFYAPQGVDRMNPYLSPLHADVNGLPPATIILAQIDPLRSDGEAYAAKLANAGVPVTLKIYEGVTHEFFGLTGLVNEAAEASGFGFPRICEAHLRRRTKREGHKSKQQQGESHENPGQK